ncbi:MAG: hypothetical protein WCI47_00470 [bacterium]
MEKKQAPSPILEDSLQLNDDEPVVAKTKHDSEAKVPELKKSQKPEQPWYKQPKIWGLIAVTTLIVTIGGLGSLAWRNRQLQQDFITDQWKGLTRQSELVVAANDKASYDSMVESTKELLSLTNRISDADTDSQKLPTFLVDASKISSFKSYLVELKKYTNSAKGYTEDIKNVKTSNLQELASMATALKLKLADSKTTLNVTDEFPDGYFKISERLDAIIAAHQNAQDEKQAVIDASKSKEEQAKIDQANAEESVARWIGANKNNDVGEMKRWMTAAYAKEFDFGEITSSYRATNYPVSFRRVSTEKKSDQYEIVHSITYVTKSDYTADTNYTQTYVFLVSQDSTSKKWLVNSRRSSY